MKIAIIVDSTAVIGIELLEKNDNLYSMPLNVIFENKTYSDGIDLHPNEFFDLVKNSTEMPKTSQPSIGEVEELFTKLVKEYDHIIYITISSKISGTYESGLMARQLVSEDKITVFDSLFTSIIQRKMTEDSLQLIKENKSLQEIMDRLKYIRENSEIIFVVDDLKYLKYNGRLSPTAAAVGTFLKIKPVLELRDGKIEVFKKIKTIRKAHQIVVDMIEAENLTENSTIILTQAKGLDYANEIRKKINKIYPNHKIRIDLLSPVISVHTGPGTIGLGWVK